MLTSILKLWTPDGGDGYNLVTDLAAFADTVENKILNPPYIRITNTSDASPVSTDHGFQVGFTDRENVIIDVNEIMARNGGNLATLYVNGDGGDIGLGNTQTTVGIPGRVNSAHTSWAQSAGRILSGAFSGSPGTVSSVSVTFPVGRFNRAPLIFPSVNTVSPQLRAVSWTDATSAGVTINQYSEGAWSAVHWTAVQMSSGNADG